MEEQKEQTKETTQNAFVVFLRKWGLSSTLSLVIFGSVGTDFAKDYKDLKKRVEALEKEAVERQLEKEIEERIKASQ